MKGYYQVEYPQHNETNSIRNKTPKPVDIKEVNRALMVLRENSMSMLDLIEKDLYDFYSTDIEVIKFVDKELVKKIVQFKQDIKNIVVYSKNLQITHEEQGRLFYD